MLISGTLAPEDVAASRTKLSPQAKFIRGLYMPLLPWLNLVYLGFFSTCMVSRGSMVITLYYEDKENVKLLPIILEMT